ncbi:MAG: M48 family metallopeptidase [Clostridiales bacterium]|nr:M48 family metallopeptidase [Clostridiales bacterium]
MKYQLIKSNRKTLAVCIDYTGKVIVKAPINLSFDKINEFLIKKSNWIAKNQIYAQNRYQKYKNLYTYNEVMYKGKIIKCAFKNARKISITSEQLLIPQKYQLPNKQNALKNALKRFLIQESEKEFIIKLNKFSSSGFKYNSLKIINSKSKWGSCDKQGNIGLNFRAIMLPSVFLNYLIAHELAHTIHFNHSTKFWDIVRSLIPDCKNIRKELKYFNFLQDLFR